MTPKKTYKTIGIFLNGFRESKLISFNCKQNSAIIETLETASESHNLCFDEIFFIDGGVESILKYNLSAKHFYWVGDFDSSAHLKTQIKSKIITNELNELEKIELNQEKNFSDFAAALDLIALNNKNENLVIEIFWGLGGRFDHELINILEISMFYKNYSQLVTFIIHPKVLISNTKIKFAADISGVFSMFSPINKYPLDICVTGSKYAGELTLTRPSHGLSNKIVNEHVEIEPHNNIIGVSFS